MDQIQAYKARRLVRLRDKAHDHLLFNEAYPQVASRLFDERSAKVRAKMEHQAKKKLYPLELAAANQTERNAFLNETALAQFQKKQELPRRAVEQSYRRKLKRGGQQEAEQFRTRKLAKLDAKLAAFQASLARKHPLDNQMADKSAAERYRAASEAQAKQMAEFDAVRAAKKKVQMENLAQKLAAENEKLRTGFQKYQTMLVALSGEQSVTMPDDVILSLRDVCMYFSGVKAVDGLSFDVRKGEIFGLIGPNGAGKSTLFNCITQFYRPTSGSIYYRDKFEHPIDLTKYRVHDVVKTGIARTFQNLELIPTITVLDNLLVGAHTFFRSGLFDQFLHTKRMRDEEEVSKTIALQVLERLDLLDYQDSTPAGLPYGVLKRIELARTLMASPRMIILDEPAAGLNDVETEDLAQAIRKIRTDFDCTIFLVEHDMNLVMGVCDTVCTISFGKMLDIGTAQYIQSSPVVQSAYLGESGESEP